MLLFKMNKIVWVFLFVLALFIPLLIYMIPKDLIIVLSGSKKTFETNKYYRTVCPYTFISCTTFTLPFHDNTNPFFIWNQTGMETIIQMSNNEIDKLKKKHNPRRLILSGISRGGYLAMMYEHADVYLLFSPVVKWSELDEFTDPGPRIPVDHLIKARVFGFVNDKDYRVNGSVVVNFFEQIQTKNNKFIIEKSDLHSVPPIIFEVAADFADGI